MRPELQDDTKQLTYNYQCVSFPYDNKYVSLVMLVSTLVFYSPSNRYSISFQATFQKITNDKWGFGRANGR